MSRNQPPSSNRSHLGWALTKKTAPAFFSFSLSLIHSLVLGLLSSLHVSLKDLFWLRTEEMKTFMSLEASRWLWESFFSSELEKLNIMLFPISVIGEERRRRNRYLPVFPTETYERTRQRKKKNRWHVIVDMLSQVSDFCLSLLLLLPLLLHCT